MTATARTPSARHAATAAAGVSTPSSARVSTGCDGSATDTHGAIRANASRAAVSVVSRARKFGS